MSTLTGDEPKHWHSDSGAHRMKDPRLIYERGKYVGETFDGKPVADTPRGLWDPDERAYAEHLEAHGIGVDDPHVEPSDDDPELVRDLFELIAAEERKLRTARKLIFTVRQALAQGKSIEDMGLAVADAVEEAGFQWRECPACRRTVGLRNDGTFRMHRPGRYTSATCRGSHHRPDDVADDPD
jgi:hypothetical protein